MIRIIVESQVTAEQNWKETEVTLSELQLESKDARG